MLFAGDDVESQTHQSLKNIREVVQSAGFTMRDVVKTTLLLADMNDFGKVNTIYAQYFADPYPARATYQVECLPKNGKIEIEAIAVREESGSQGNESLE
ncbi:unnamed protein product [Schistosoma curassoni]|nr:unnamed protein product [Schistosoma curassoni]